MNKHWSDERIAELKKLWAEGRSATQIAQILGGVSRNAVLGKLHRLELGAIRPSKVTIAKVNPIIATGNRPKKKADPVKAAAVKAIEHRPAPPTIPAPLFAKLFELGRNDCRWPVKGEKEHTLFCGHEVETGCSYCPGHKRMSVGAGTLSERNAVPAKMVA